jgi:DNA-directed RNA polymerase specialized sigma24 family protein
MGTGDGLADQFEDHRPHLRTAESDAMLAESVGLARLIVLDTLEPAERLAFVLQDVFGMTFDEIAPIVERSPVAARQLASRARQARHASSEAPKPWLDKQRRSRKWDCPIRSSW